MMQPSVKSQQVKIPLKYKIIAAWRDVQLNRLLGTNK